MAAGDTYASQRLSYTDPVAGLTGVRLTVDGNAGHPNYLQDMSGEQGLGSPWAPDSVRICYAKGGTTTKDPGVYMMNTDTGIETQLVELTSSATFRSYPVWSRGGTDEVYYYDTSGTTVLVKAVATSAPWTTRTIASVAGDSSPNRQKLGINADGSLIAAHIIPNGQTAYRTIIAETDGGGILANWTSAGPAGADGSYWHMTDPRLIVASRGDGDESCQLYNVDTAVAVHLGNFRASHAAMHPDGTRMFQIDSQNYVNPNTGTTDWHEGGQGQIHPHFAPCDAALGDNARMVADEAPFYFNTTSEGPLLWVVTPAQMETFPAASACWRYPGTEVGYHWSRSANNSSHPHPTISPDGRRILWVSDKKSHLHSAWVGTYAMPVGPAEGSEDLFMLYLEEETTPPDPEDPAAGGMGWFLGNRYVMTSNDAGGGGGDPGGGGSGGGSSLGIGRIGYKTSRHHA